MNGPELGPKLVSYEGLNIFGIVFDTNIKSAIGLRSRIKLRLINR